MRVFLTGATGLVGSHVAERLVRDGHEVKALVRPGAELEFLRSLGAELVSGDITDRDALVEAMSGCDGVVHSAALIVGDVPWEDYRRVNVDGTQHVLEAAAQGGARRAVHVSTVAVYGGSEISRQKRVDEDHPTDGPLPPGEFYGRSKRGAEEVALSFQAEGRLEVTIVRPDVVYGERDRVLIPRLARYLRSPLAFTVGLGHKELPLVYAGNIADAITRALTSPRAPGRVYNLANDFPISQRKFFSLIAARLPGPKLLLPLPYLLAYGAAAAIELAARMRSARPATSRRHVAFMGRGNPFVSDRAREELGWEPAVEHVEGVRRAMAWFQSLVKSDQ